MAPPMLATREQQLGVSALILSLLCAAWALWPAVFPVASVPSVTRQNLPPLKAVTAQAAAPVYPTTASITPLISGRLNLNTATQEQLEALPNVGPALAGRIMAARPLHSLAELDAVKGVGPSLLKKWEGKIEF